MPYWESQINQGDTRELNRRKAYILALLYHIESSEGNYLEAEVYLNQILVDATISERVRIGANIDEGMPIQGEDISKWINEVVELVIGTPHWKIERGNS